MSIDYRYEIVRVDEDARCMEIVYTADGHPKQHISARLPFEGEPLDAVIRQYEPVNLWIQLSTPVYAPSVGISGVMTLKEEAEDLETVAAGSINKTEL